MSRKISRLKLSRWLSLIGIAGCLLLGVGLTFTLTIHPLTRSLHSAFRVLVVAAALLALAGLIGFKLGPGGRMGWLGWLGFGIALGGFGLEAGANLIYLTLHSWLNLVPIDAPEVALPLTWARYTLTAGSVALAVAVLVTQWRSRWARYAALLVIAGVAVYLVGTYLDGQTYNTLYRQRAMSRHLKGVAIAMPMFLGYALLFFNNFRLAAPGNPPLSPARPAQPPVNTSGAGLSGSETG